MMSNRENNLKSPHENVESEIKDCLRETEQDIIADRIIHAYYNLIKTNKMITQLTDSAEKYQLKKQYKLLNNKLNSEILKLIEKDGK